MYIFIKNETRRNAENQIIRFMFISDTKVIKIIFSITDSLPYYYVIFISHKVRPT